MYIRDRGQSEWAYLNRTALFMSSGSPLFRDMFVLSAAYRDADKEIRLDVFQGDPGSAAHARTDTAFECTLTHFRYADPRRR